MPAGSARVAPCASSRGDRAQYLALEPGAALQAAPLGPSFPAFGHVVGGAPVVGGVVTGGVAGGAVAGVVEAAGVQRVAKQAGRFGGGPFGCEGGAAPELAF